MKRSRLALLQSVIALLLCFSMLVGTTFAWFTDSVSNGKNVIAAGTLDVQLEYLDANGSWATVDEQTKVLDENAIWEPGYTEVVYLKITNGGNLALKYALGVGVLKENGSINAAGQSFYLSDYIRYGLIESETEPSYALREDALNALTDSKIISEGTTSTGAQLDKNGDTRYVTLVVYMPEDIGNVANYATGVTPPEIELGLELIATQAEYESDSFGSDYDQGASLSAFHFPGTRYGVTTSAGVEKDANNQSVGSVSLIDEQASAEVPAGVQLEQGANILTLEVTSMNESNANITLGENDAVRSLNVHVDGVSKDNTQPMEITIKEAAAKGLNAGNLKLYHVENGTPVAMTVVDTFTAHNQFKYDPATGDITLYMATFSEVAMVADTVNAWNGNIADEFSSGSGADSDPYIIANADQLAYLNEVISNDNENYGKKFYKLVADINLGYGVKDHTYTMFYPIGYHKEGGSIVTVGLDDAPEAAYIIEEDTRTRGSTMDDSGSKNWYTYGGAFQGTFDGAGHTIANIYQNTWEMKGNYDGNYWNAAMGLFGYVYGGTVKNLAVHNFTSDGEFTPTGVIAAYAAASTFENIAITNCNPRVYNTGNGGIVGIGGNSSDTSDKELTFTNITIDNTNKISALWGSYDVACGGLVGMFRGAGSVNMTNCHVAAQLDVFNDVCGNYQYYWYRYAGMMIGTNKNMITDKDGYTVPETSKFRAKDCTVHFGEWNDYYYCELVANSLASYTHDHQFSRLTEISSLDEIKSGDTWTKTGNFLLISDDGKSCYHIVKDADGTLRQHLHTDAGEETVNGQPVLKEDKQIVYLPFNQLFTGYGWGVKHIPIDDNTGFEGITILNREVANSVKKFNGKVTTLSNNKEYTIGEIFEENTGNTNKVEIKDSAVVVGITNLDENNPVSAAFTAGTNWADGTISFTGTGKIMITIQDYYFCTPTTIEVDIEARTDATKFESKFTGDFLYRVGNANTVDLGSLFDVVKNEDDTPKYTIDSSKVEVTVEAQSGTAVSGTYTANTSDWTMGTIQFSGTGVVKVTITDNVYCTPTELTVEIINATNLTSATGTTTGGTFVLVSDVHTSTYVNYWNCTVYGNGFTYSLKDAPTAYNSKQGHGILITQNAVLDNLKIVGDIYKGYGAYKDNDYYNTAIDVMGDTTIRNCYIANCAAPVKARSNVTIIDSTLYGGTVANLLIMSGTATLENVTTANYDDGRSMVGMGIVVHSDATESAKLVLNGKLTQYNFINESKVPTDSYAQELHNAMFDSSCDKYHFGTSPNRSVNTGIISLTDTFNGEDITDNANTGYEGASISRASIKGYVYTQPNTSGSVNNNYSEDNFSGNQSDYLPTPNFSLSNQAVTGEDRYLKGDINGIEARYIEGEAAFTLDIDKLMTVEKYGIPLPVSAVCKDAQGKEYTGVVTLSAAGIYTLQFTATDNLIYDKAGNLTGESKERIYTVSITLVVAEPAIKDAVITVSKTALDGSYSGLSDQTASFNPLNAITITDVEGTVNLTTNIASTNIAYASSSSAYAGATTITVTYNDGRILTITLGKPTLNSPGSSKAITYANNGTIKSAGAVAKKSATGGTWTVTSYSFKGTNGKTVTNNTVVTFTFPDKSCVTGDTLVMLADGTQKRIDEVTYNDQLLVWNFFEGKYDVVPSAIIFYHGDDNYRVLQLNFNDGTKVKVLNNHGFYDADENAFVFVDEHNVDSYIGHNFVKVNGTSYKTVKLISYETYEEYTGCYSIQSAVHNNFMVEGMFSLTIPHYEGWFDYFEIGENMKYDEAKKQADIEKYGLYDYSEFAEYVTYEQFIAFNGPYLKVLVGRGVVTFEQILNLIATYVTN